MTDPRRIASIACFMLVTLRLMIGWQLLYEGFWKVKTLKSPTPWTAAGYLKNSQGPFRDAFRNLAGDPDDLSWIEAQPIDAEAKPGDMRYWLPGVEQRWDDWQGRFERHYRLNEGQKNRLTGWLNGAKEFKVELAELPGSVDKLPSSMKFNAGEKRLVIRGHLLPSDRSRLQSSLDSDLDGVPNIADASPDGKTNADAEDDDGDGILNAADVDATGGDDKNKNGIDDSTDADKEASYLTALDVLFKKSKDGLSFKAKARATVAGNPDWIEDSAQQRVGEIRKYKSMLAEYEADLAAAKKANSVFPFQDSSFRFDHLQHTWGKIQAKRSELVGPVKALDKDLRDRAQNMLSVEQLKLGPVPEPWTQLRISDMMTIAGLTILGAMLILGLGTRLAAIMAAVMLFMFYAAMPPWPGVPAVPGPEHSFIVNKNFIEVVALLAIAALPTGRWFGVDGMIGRLLASRHMRNPKK